MLAQLWIISDLLLVLRSLCLLSLDLFLTCCRKPPHLICAQLNVHALKQHGVSAPEMTD